MKKIVSVILFLSLGIYLPPVLAAKVYLCAKAGSVSYSNTPCSIPPTDRTIQAVTATKINDLVINETLSLLRRASKTRDIRAIERLLSNDFTFVSRDENWNGRIIFNADKASFITLSRDHLLAMTSYEQIIEKFSLKKINGDLVAETQAVEKVSIGKKNFEVKIVERVLVKIEHGKAKIRSIQQIEL
jgi:hypothetical protein